MVDELIQVPMDKIFPPYILLRLLNRRSLAYIELRDSIKEVGLLSSICVRKSYRKEGWYEIITGMWRWSCCKDLGYITIPGILKEVDDTVVLKMQIMENAIRAKTNPVDYANQMKRLFMADSTMTFASMAMSIKKSPHWVKQMLGLLNLYPEAATKTDRGEIPLTSAYMLAKLPKWMQVEVADEAILLSAKDFCRLCQQRLMDFRQLSFQEKRNNFYRNKFIPQPYLQQFQVLVAEYKHLAVGPTLILKNSVIKPIDVWKLAISWVLHLDRDNLIEQERHIKERFDEIQVNIQKRSNDRVNKFDSKLLEKLV